MITAKGIFGTTAALMLFLLVNISPGFAAEQDDTVDDASTTALTAGNSAKFTAPAAGTDEVFTVGDGVNVGEGGVIVSTTTANGVGTLRFLGDSTATGNIGATGARLGILEINGGTGKTATVTGSVFAVDINFTAAGTLFLGGNTTVTNDIDFNNNAGTLSVGSGVAIVGSIDNTGGAGGNVTFGGNSNVTGNMGGTNALGTLTLNGTNTTVATIGSINAGTWSLNGNSLTATTTASLAANGTINTTITSATSAGKVTSTGNAIIPTTTTLSITVTATDYIASGTTFTIVDGAAAGGAVSTIAAIADDSTVLSFSQVTTNTDDLIITATRTSTFTSTVSEGSTGSGAAATLSGISSSGATGDMATVLGSLDSLSGTSQAKAILTTSPEVSGGGVDASFVAQGQSLRTVSNRLGDLRANRDSDGITGFSTGNSAKGVGVWMRGFGSDTSQDRRKNVDGYNAQSVGVAFGADKELMDARATLGGSYSYAISDVDSNGDRSGSGTDITSYQLTVYGDYNVENWFVEGQIAGSYNKYDGTRLIDLGTSQRNAQSDYAGKQYTGDVTTGATYPVGIADVTPRVGMRYSQLNIDGYTETGANALNLIVEDQTYVNLRSSVGTEVSFNVDTGAGVIIPSFRGSYFYEIIADKQEVTSTYSGAGGSFSTEGADPARHGASLGFGVSMETTSNFTLSADYDAELKDNYVSQNGVLTLRYEF